MNIYVQAVELLKKGGTFVYSTCSIAPQENEEQVKWILDNFPSLSLAEQVSYHTIVTICT